LLSNTVTVASYDCTVDHADANWLIAAVALSEAGPWLVDAKAPVDPNSARATTAAADNERALKYEVTTTAYPVFYRLERPLTVP
jgi:hypothetical protein